MKMKAFVSTLLTLLLIILFSSCHNSSDLDTNGVPGKLLIGMYGGDNPSQTHAAMGPMKDYLEKKLGMEVEFIFATDYTSVIEALRSKKIHMAELTPFGYILATQHPGLEPIVTLGFNGKPTLYHSIIFTNPKTGIKTMDEVKARAKNLSLCFADPASTSGHLVPRAYLTSIGLDPEKTFRQTIFAGSHAASILSVASGKIDIGCSSSDLALDKLVREGVVKKNEIVVLWTSPPIVNDAMTVRTDLNKAFIQKIKDAYLNMAKDDFAAFKPYVSLYYTDPHKMAYVTVADSQYNALRRMAGNIKELKFNK
jgi:phosphonate transport system substrate-binding protein